MQVLCCCYFPQTWVDEAGSVWMVIMTSAELQSFLSVHLKLGAVVFFFVKLTAVMFPLTKLSVRLFSPVMMMMMKLPPPCTAPLARRRLALNNLWL